MSSLQQPDGGLLLDALECPDRQVARVHRNRHETGFRIVAILSVGPFRARENPAISLEGCHNLAASHEGRGEPSHRSARLRSDTGDPSSRVTLDRGDHASACAHGRRTGEHETPLERMKCARRSRCPDRALRARRSPSTSPRKPLGHGDGPSRSLGLLLSFSSANHHDRPPDT